MKNRVFILSFLISMISVNFVFAQTSTKKLSYQAVVRNAANELVVNQNLAVEITILNAENAPQYKETHPSVPTNQNGLLWLWVGEGTPTLGTMANVVWKDATIRSVFTLPDGSTVTQNTPVTAMPYAFFADEVDTIFLQDYLTTHNYGNDDYVTHQELNDTLNHYYTNEQVDAALIPYATNAHLNDTLSHYLMKEVQVLSISHDTIFLTGGSFVVLPKGFSGSYHDLVDTPTNVSVFNNDAGYLTEHQSLEGYVTQDALHDTLSYYTTTGSIDTLLGAYFDSTQVKTAIHDTAEAIRAAIPASQVNADWNATSGPAEILNKPDLSVYATTNALKDSLSRYVGKDKLNDTLDSYYTKNNIDNKLNDYEKKSELCGDVKDCIKDTLGKYTTTNQIDTLLGAFFDSTQVKNAIHDTADAIRAAIPASQVNADWNATGGPAEILHKPNLSVYATKDELNDYEKKSDLCGDVKECIDDTLKHYTTSDKIDTLLGAYFDSTKVKTAIHDTASALRALMGDAANDGLLMIVAAGDTTRFTANQATNDTVRLNKFATKDTLAAYYDTADVKQMLKPYLKANELCDSIVKCDVIKDMRDSLDNAFDTLKYYYTSKKTNDTLKHYYDTAYVNQTLKQYLKSGDLCDSIEKNCTNVALKNKDNLFTLRNQFDSTVFFKDATYFDSTAYFNERAYFDEDVNVKGDVIFKGYNYYYNVNNFYEHDAIVLIDEAVNPNTLGPVQSTQDQNLNRRLAVNYNDLMVVYDTLKKTAQNGNAALAARIVADSNRLVEFKGKVHNDSLALAERIDTIYSHLCDSVMNCTDIKTMQTDIAANATNIGFNKQAIIDSSAHIRNDIKNGQITIAVNRSTTTTETTVTNPTFGVNQEADQTVTINIPQETTVNNGQLTIVAAGDTTRFTANQATNDTVRLDKFATKDTLSKYTTTDNIDTIVNKHHFLTSDSALIVRMRDSIQKVNAHVSADSLVLATKIHADSVDLAKHISDSTRMVFDTLHKYYATKDTLKNFVNKLAIRDSVNKVVKDSLRIGTSAINIAIDTIARHNIHDTAVAIRTHIRDSVNVVMLDSLKLGTSAINQAIDTIARHNIHDTAVAIRALIPTVPTNVSAFINDAKYVNNASCDSLDFCALMAKVNALANSMGEFNNTINDMQHTIDSLEGVIDALSSLLPKVTLTTDQTTVPIGSGDVASVICTATLKNANGYTLYWKVDGTDSTSNHNTPFTVNFTTVGTHKIVCTAKQEGSPDLKDSVTITITKGTPTVNVTLATGLVYTGAPQALVTAGSTTGGTLQYKLNDGAYSTDIPEASAVGSYTVSYKVVGNDNWNDVDETSEDVTIAKMPINPTVSITGWTSCEPANIPSVTGNTGNAPVTYEYKVNGADDNTYGATIPVSAGEYTIRATVAETANYSAGVATADFTIAAGSGCEEPSGTPATILVAPTATPGTITSGTTTPLVTEGQAENGTMMYAVTTSAQPQLSDFSATVPTAATLTAGTCYVWYYAQGNIPYINSPIAGPIEVTVTPPPFSVGSNKKVYFAPANLQASTSDQGVHWTWQFAENEWDYVGNTALNTRVGEAGGLRGVLTTGKVDLFSWVGASNTTWSGELGTQLNAAMHGIADATSTNSNYGSSASDVLKSDWGNTINDGHNWRTLTSEEWAYLLGIRASGSTVAGKNGNVSNARYTLAKINTDGSNPVRGLIIFPDGITIEASEFTQAGFINREIGETSADTWEKGTLCTTAQWAALSAKGCVFLPTAGQRYHNPGETYPGVLGATDATGYAGHYWSSSPSGTTTAYFVLFTRSFVDPRSSDHLLTISERRFGLSVRLVRDAE